MPIRIGGFDQISSYVAPGSTASGRQAVNRSPTPSASAFSLASRTARSLTSIAVTVQPGTATAIASPMTPYPQPRSSTEPAPSGADCSRSSTPVPMSSRPWANTPEPDVSSSQWPQTLALTGIRLKAACGSAVK